MNSESIKKCEFYANARRAYSVLISKYENGDFVDYWHPKLRGNFISLKGRSLHKNKKDATEEAREFRDMCKMKLKELQK